MKKIAFLNEYQGKVSRGAETYVTEVSQRLSKTYRVDVISKVNFIDLLRKRYDVVIPTNGRLQVGLTRIVTWLTGGRMIVSAQSGPGFDDRWNLYSFPDVFIALSDFALKWAKKVNPFVKTVIIPNGVDLNKFKVNDQNSNKEKTVLAVGAFTKEKRHELTIKVVSKLKDVKLIIAGGGGNLKEEIKNLGEKLLGNRFEIKSIANDEMPKIYKEASVFVYPTVPWESFGIAIVEAMATNLAVVANNDPIRKEIVGEGGLLVDPENIEEYANTIQKALTTDFGNKPRKQAEKFNWDEIAERYIELIENLN